MTKALIVGEYDKNGWKVPNRSALPWERNNLKGAFEMESANGSFGIRMPHEAFHFLLQFLGDRQLPFKFNFD